MHDRVESTAQIFVRSARAAPAQTFGRPEAPDKLRLKAAIEEAVMSEPPFKKGHDGCLEAVLGSLIGVGVGFGYGFLFVIACSLPFNDPEGWAIFGALMVGGGSAVVGGFVGLGTATVVGVRALVKAVATKGALGGLIGVVLGFAAGFLVNGLMYRSWDWSSEASLNFALLGGRPRDYHRHDCWCPRRVEEGKGNNTIGRGCGFG